MLQTDHVQAVLVEEHLSAVGRRHVERLHHHDGVGRADLHAQLAELAGVELEREALGVVAFSLLSISTLITAGERTYSHRRQPMRTSSPVSFS